ncbi:MAG: radical SAM family protein [Bacillota bacterium]|nr:MAG: radical SAM family protein [Bacillota bacterium]
MLFLRPLFLAINASYTHTSLSARYILAACATAGIHLELVEVNINERAEKIAHLVAEHEPSVLLCSVYIWNIRLMEDVCTRLKLMFPSLTIIWGGPEVAFNPEEVLVRHGYVDVLCVGEGEVVTPRVLTSLVDGGPLGATEGIACRGGDITARPKVGNLDYLPDPYGAGEEFVPHKLYYFETSRGCPYACAYCLSSAEAGVRFMSISEAERRLAFLSQQVPLVKFVDRTFNANPMRARVLWEYMLDLPGDSRFHFEICAHLLEEQDFRVLSRPEAIRFQFEVGLQSTYGPALSAINRAMDTTKLLANVERLLALGTVEVHVDLIAGLPGENLVHFHTTFNKAMSVLPHRLHMGFLKLLPGTALRRASDKHGYAFLPYAPYEVLRSHDLTPRDLLQLKGLEHNLNRYYNSNIATHSMRYALSVVQPSELFTLLSGEVPAQHIHEFLLQSIQGAVPDEKLLQELLRFDFCLMEPHRKIPEVLHYGPGDEDKVLRELLYGDERQIYSVLPHRQGEKPGTILRSLRLVYYRPATLRYLNLSEGDMCIFDYSCPLGRRAFVIPKGSGSQS